MYKVIIKGSYEEAVGAAQRRCIWLENIKDSSGEIIAEANCTWNQISEWFIEEVDLLKAPGSFPPGTLLYYSVV